MASLVWLFAATALSLAPTTVEIRVLDGLSGRPVTAQVLAERSAAAGPEDRDTRTTTEAQGGRARLPLAAGLWTISANHPRLWGWPKRLFIDPSRPSTAEVVLELWPTGRVSGTLRVPDRESAPGAIGVRPYRVLSPESWASLDGGDASIRCPVQGTKWACDLPVGALDLHLDLAPFMPRYLWGISVRRDETTLVGETKLEKGGSVSGWIRDPDGRPAPDAIASLRIPGERETPSYSAQTNQRGFFQIGPVPDASYDLIASHGAQISHPVTAKVAGREEKLREPLTLQLPAKLEITVEPPLDPAGIPWRVSLLSVKGSGGNVVVRQATMDATGRWSRPTLPAGRYRLAIMTSSGQVWHESPLEVRPGGEPIAVSLRIDHLAGVVLIGDEPMKGRVRLGNAAGGAQLTFESDESGRFGGLLPRLTENEGDWSALVDSSNPLVRRHLEHVPVERIGESDVRIDLRLPAGAVEGIVLDDTGRPFTETSVVFAHSLNDQSELGMVQAKLSPADGGSFRLRGLAEGEYRIHASARGRQSNDIQVRVKETGSAEKVTLVLKQERSLSGRVIAGEGRPVPGAELLVFPADAPYTLVRTLHSDGEGRFTTALPSGASDVILQVGAVGFARRLLRRPVPASKELLVELDSAGGTLVLDSLDPHQHDQSGVYVIHQDGGFESFDSLLRWSTLHSEAPATDGTIRIPQLAAGHYRVCRVSASEYQAFMMGTLDPRRCAEGDLPRGGELRLTLRVDVQPRTSPSP